MLAHLLTYRLDLQRPLQSLADSTAVVVVVVNLRNS